MAYTLRYWQAHDLDTHSELKSTRLSSIEEAVPLALEHNRPPNTALITVERHRNYKGKKWIDEKIVWSKKSDRVISPVIRSHRTKR